MADAVTTIIQDTDTHLLVHLTNISDGTGESAVTKVDKSAYTATDGAEPDSLDIETARWNIQGFTSVRILWDHTTDDVAMVLSGSGFDDFRGDEFVRFKKGLPDPRSAGDTGDIKLTTAGAVSGATYDITLRLRKTPQ
jgi:hypothetical protein